MLSLLAISSPLRAPETPPSSDVECDVPPRRRLPPSPPLSPKPAYVSSAARLLGVLRLRQRGGYVGSCDWRTFRLDPGEHVEVESRLQEDRALWTWYEGHCRYDYDPLACEYALRMPSALHERFIASVEDEIARQIGRLAEKLQQRQSALADELRKVYKGRSTTVELHTPVLENSNPDTVQSGCTSNEQFIIRRSPDATFYHPSAPDCPALVLEVSYSQRRKDWPRLAESYIVDSQHAIRCVVGVDVTYLQAKGATERQDKTACFSVWRPGTEKDADGEDLGVCRTDMECITFRDIAGHACAGVLDIAICDLLPPNVLDLFGEQDPGDCVSIPFTDLCTFLRRAESSVANTTPAPTSTPKKFRKRKRTPSEILSADREEVYLRQEQAQLEKEQMLDREWKWRSRRILGNEEHETEVVERRKSLRIRASGRTARTSV